LECIQRHIAGFYGLTRTEHRESPKGWMDALDGSSCPSSNQQAGPQTHTEASSSLLQLLRLLFLQGQSTSSPIGKSLLDDEQDYRQGRPVLLNVTPGPGSKRGRYRQVTGNLDWIEILYSLLYSFCTLVRIIVDAGTCHQTCNI